MTETEHEQTAENYNENFEIWLKTETAKEINKRLGQLENPVGDVTHEEWTKFVIPELSYGHADGNVNSVDTVVSNIARSRGQEA